MALYHEHPPFSAPPYVIDIIQHIALPPLGTFDAFDRARGTQTGGRQIMNTTQRSRRPHQGLYIVQQHKEASDLGTSEQILRIDKGLDGKTIHVVGPRRLHNEMLVSFIGKETGADCLLTDFDLVKGYLVDTAEEPSRLFLIDYREPRFQEMLKQASLDTSSSTLVERLISLFNSSKEENAAERKHTKSTCGVLFNCNSTTTLLH